MKIGKGEADKPTIQRKEAKKTMPVGALSQKETQVSKLPFVIRFAQKKAIETVEETDTLLHDGLSEFERQLIQECREDGMSDSEIQEWMQEI